MSNPAPENLVEQLPGESRGMPSVNEVGPSTAKRGAFVMFMLFMICVLGGILYWKTQGNSQKIEAQQKNLQITSSVPARTFTAPPESTPPPLPGTTNPTVTAVAVPPALPNSAPALPGGNVSAPMAPNGKPVPPLDKSGSSLMAAVANKPQASNGSAANPQASSGTTTNNLALESREQADRGSISNMLTATETPARQAGMLGNRNFILAKGSFIDCALQTRLDSTVPGMTACVITRNIYSDNGNVLLIERGSTVTGEYQSNMKQGMARIFVLWSRIKTPNGVIINLDSPGTDQLGGSGVPGYINNHFWKRFGGALMLSLVDDIARGITNNSGSSGNQFNFNSAGDATQEMAAEALKNTINIPPTLYKNQGEQVGIYIARDLDFSSVYDVQAQ